MRNVIPFIHGMVYASLILVSWYAYDLHRNIGRSVNQQVAYEESEDYLTAITRGRK